MKMRNLLSSNWYNFMTDPFPINRRLNNEIICRNTNCFNNSSMSSENIRFLINEILKCYSKTYLEVGVARGSTLLSAAIYNPHIRCIGIDNFSQFNPDNNNKSVLLKSIEQLNLKNIELIEDDYKSAIHNLFSKEPNLKIDTYFYDGNHEYLHEKNGLSIMLPYLSKKCIVMVDDINFKDVQQATSEFLNENRDFELASEIYTFQNHDQNIKWHNGFAVLSRGFTEI